MKATELVRVLNVFIEHHGDQNVRIANSDNEYGWETQNVDGVHFQPAKENKVLSRPASIIIGHSGFDLDHY